MTTMTRALTIALLAASCISAAAVEKPASSPPATSAAAGAQFTLRDGTIIIGRTELKAIEVITAYGTLSVPITDVMKVRVGKKSDRDLKAKIDRAISDLGSKDFAARDQATTDLAKLGRLAYTELRKAANSDDLEVKERATKLLDDMGVVEDEADIPPENDEVVTPTFIIAGTIKLDTLSISTKFGTLKVAKKDLAKMSVGEAEQVTRAVSVPAKATAGKMVATGIRVKRGDRLAVTAQGSVNYRNYGGTQFSPEGSSNYGNWNENIMIGALIGRIGASGSVFKVGERYNDKIEADGELHLGIAAVESAGNYGNGEYKVRVQIQPAAQ
ncbi:MAG: hypothetical protein HZA91_11985 [Verrucomicrobia bacterium]|nr:hypothetical protein [Verrucomicrobiota bacterium]